MAGRKKHPINVLEYTGRKHLTKKEKDERREAEVEIPNGLIKCPRWVRTNIEARRKWKEVAPLLTEIAVLKPTDVGALGRYCVLNAQLLDLIRLRNEVSAIEPFDAGEEVQIMEEFEKKRGSQETKLMWKKVEFIFSAQAILSFDKAINQKMTAILAIEDRLGLNIIARAKLVVPKENTSPANPTAERFANV